MSSPRRTVWRESASLIIATRAKVPTNACDYQLLLLKRSDRTAVGNNHCVFPGGIFDSFDESVEWLKYFEDFGVRQQDLKQLVLVNEQRPQILAPRGNGCYDRFFKRSSIWAREISLRITALRETFEETGVLLGRTRSQLATVATPSTGCVIKDFDVDFWQRRVHNNVGEFLNLCRELNAVPDLWALYEWSVWASPAPILKGYETAFFITFLPDMPPLLLEPTEIKDYVLQSPEALLQMDANRELYFLPPQIYELLRFKGVKSFDWLLQFAKERALKGTTLHLPIGYICTDGVVSVLPGDDFYKGDPRSYTEFISLDMTTEEFRAKAKRLHRAERFGMPEMTMLCNFKPLNDHLPPLQGGDGRNKL